jgi:hypothetical protein
VGGTTATVRFRVLINERLHGATVAKENALDNIVSSGLAVTVLSAKSVDVTTKYAKTGKIGFHSCGLEIRRIVIISMRQNRMNPKEEIESIFSVLWSKAGAVKHRLDGVPDSLVRTFIGAILG